MTDNERLLDWSGHHKFHIELVSALLIDDKLTPRWRVVFLFLVIQNRYQCELSNWFWYPSIPSFWEEQTLASQYQCWIKQSYINIGNSDSSNPSDIAEVIMNGTLGSRISKSISTTSRIKYPTLGLRHKKFLSQDQNSIRIKRTFP